MKVGVIIGSTRDGRLGERVGKWVETNARQMNGWEVTVLDVKIADLPLYDDATTPTKMGGTYPLPSVNAWAAKVAAQDAFLIVTAEYNHGIPAPLKNALDWLYPEWANKAAGIVSYSGSPSAGLRSAEQLRLVLAHLGLGTVQIAVSVASAQDAIAEDGTPINERLGGALNAELNQIDSWGKALNTVRADSLALVA